MQWHDSLYGPWELPEGVARLVLTDRAVRMHDIAQSVLPRMLEPYGPMPSRFVHGLGVCRLAVELVACQGYQLDERYGRLLPVAAFLHDCGNPPFSHLAEPFLKKDFAHDGESFLTAMLQGSQTALEIERMGLSIKEVTDMVTGQDVPVAEVLAGSMDIDNLDNVARYWVAASNGQPAGYDPLALAASYRFDPIHRRWSLWASGFRQAQAWKKCRQDIYELIYAHPHWGIAAMVQRALYLHWKLNGGLRREFYFLTDTQAALELMASPVLGARELMTLAANHDWYEPVVAIKLEEPVTGRLRTFCGGDALARHTLADSIAQAFRIPAHRVCAAIGKGRDQRKITLPFISAGGSQLFHDEDSSESPWRVFVWIHPGHAGLRDGIERYVQATVL
jgi:HD superfamily phosphohydrolase